MWRSLKCLRIPLSCQSAFLVITSLWLFGAWVFPYLIHGLFTVCVLPFIVFTQNRTTLEVNLTFVLWFYCFLTRTWRINLIKALFLGRGRILLAWLDCKSRKRKLTATHFVIKELQCNVLNCKNHSLLLIPNPLSWKLLHLKHLCCFTGAGTIKYY